MVDDLTSGWFSVRCVFKASAPGSYEERITLWRAAGFDEAISLAESEAAEYAAGLQDVHYLGLAQAFELFDEPGHGKEVFSLVRDSDLGPREYLESFFDTGGERGS